MWFIISTINQNIARAIRAIPGETYFGEFRLLPIFFFGGAVIEFMMIKWQPNGVNFYNVYKKKRIAEIIQQRQKELSDPATA